MTRMRRMKVMCTQYDERNDCLSVGLVEGAIQENQARGERVGGADGCRKCKNQQSATKGDEETHALWVRTKQKRCI